MAGDLSEEEMDEMTIKQTLVWLQYPDGTVKRFESLGVASVGHAVVEGSQRWTVGAVEWRHLPTRDGSFCLQPYVLLTDSQGT